MITLATLIENYWKWQGDFSNVNYNPENPYLLDPSKIPPYLFSHFAYDSLVGAGRNALAVRLCQGDVVKIGQYPIFPQRGFDVPTNRFGHVDNISYNIQPYVVIARNWRDVYIFEETIKRLGYCFSDPGPQQIGTYKGKQVLVDYESVELDENCFSIDAL